MTRPIKLISVFAIIFLSVFLIIGYYSINQKSETVNKINEEKSQPLSKIIDFSDFNSVFHFSASIPFDWQVDYIPQIGAINIYNPNIEAENELEKSQIFIRYFESTKFLTLTTVDFLLKESATIMGHEAMRYEIQKRSSVPNFPYQPSWRSARHKLIDIRLSKLSPSLFYVFAYNPELPASDFDKFINSIEFYTDTSLALPLENALSRVIKKPFDIYITPKNSPISPEKFTGYHTGIDFEIFKGEEDKSISVYAICNGKLLVKEFGKGYGGVAVQSCNINNQPVTVVYGHLKLESIASKIGDQLTAGSAIGILGQGNTSETDFERKHLHLGIHKGTEVDTRGYVATKTELEKWIDPMILLKQK